MLFIIIKDRNKLRYIQIIVIVIINNLTHLIQVKCHVISIIIARQKFIAVAKKIKAFVVK